MYVPTSYLETYTLYYIDIWVLVLSRYNGVEMDCFHTNLLLDLFVQWVLMRLHLMGYY